MSKIEGYSTYQTNLYENQAQGKKENAGTVKEKSTNEVQTSQVELSDAAQQLLGKLKEKYKDMDFMVASYSTDEEASAYLSRGTKEYSVLIDPETLEKMAADEETKKKYMSVLDNAKMDFSKIQDKLADDGKEVTQLGISIDKNGKLSYFAELEQMSDKQAQRIEEKRAEQKEEKAAAEKKKKTRVQADSIDELLEKIKKIDWNKIKAEEPPMTGGKIDFSI